MATGENWQQEKQQPTATESEVKMGREKIGESRSREERAEQAMSTHGNCKDNGKLVEKPTDERERTTDKRPCT